MAYSNILILLPFFSLSLSSQPLALFFRNLCHSKSILFPVIIYIVLEYFWKAIEKKKIFFCRNMLEAKNTLKKINKSRKQFLLKMLDWSKLLCSFGIRFYAPLKIIGSSLARDHWKNIRTTKRKCYLVCRVCRQKYFIIIIIVMFIIITTRRTNPVFLGYRNCRNTRCTENR